MIANTSGSDLNTAIAQILRQRHVRKPLIETLLHRVQAFWECIAQLRTLATQTLQSPNLPADFVPLANQLIHSLESVHSKLPEFQQRLRDLRERFNRPTITIGVAGKARQGKSTLLQAITGLDDTVIPTSDGLPCTGAKSRIRHVDGDSEAIIEFYTESEFLKDIVHSYYEDLELPSRPITLDQFLQQPLPKLLKDRPDHKALYDRLKTIQAGIRNSRSLLNQLPRSVSLREIRQYVTQDSQHTEYLAVRNANISVKFPGNDVSSLEVIDLPGLGEIGQTHRLRLVSALRKDVDAVLLVKLPADTGDKWGDDDIGVFRVIHEAAPEVELKDLLFVVLNRKQDGANAKQIQQLLQNFPEIGCRPELLTINCRDSHDVRANLFRRVVEYLAHALPRMDACRISSVTQDIQNAIQFALLATKHCGEYLESHGVETDDYKTYRRLYKQFLEGLKASLNTLVEEYRTSSGKETSDSWRDEFRQRIEGACDQAGEAVSFASEDQLRKLYHYLGGWESVVTSEMHRLRSWLSFFIASKLEEFLAETVDDFRSKAVEVALEPLKALVPEQPSSSPDPARMLNDLLKRFNREDQRTLYRGMEFLCKYNYSYVSHLHYRVRDALNALDPQEPPGREALKNICEGASGSSGATQVSDGLDHYFHETVREVKQHLLDEALTDPLRSLFAATEEFSDQLIRGERSDDEWDSFLYPLRAYIWPEKFALFAERSELKEKWKSALARLHEASQLTTESLQELLPKPT